MKVIVSLDNPNHPGWLKLEESLKRHKWEYHTIVKEWKGFGTKIIGLYDYLIDSNVNQFIYLDAYDTYCIAGPDELKHKPKGNHNIILSTEKGCYPDTHNIGKFPTVAHDWKYINSGQIWGKAVDFCKIYQMNPPRYEDDDQRWYTNTYLNLVNQCDWVGLDYCNMFQSIAFESEGDFDIRYGRLYNNKTHTFPMFIHGNGKTDMTKFYQL